jgi:Rod binding domain-containing protein
MAAPVALVPSPAAAAALADLGKKSNAASSNVNAIAQDFEGMFINSMFQQMFANVGQGPFGGGQGANVWRSFLTDEYAKTFAKAGGLGIADQVRSALLARQEVR